MKSKIFQNKKLKKFSPNYTPENETAGTPIKVTKIQHAKRLLSRLIYQLQAGEIQGQEAKDLTYLLISYVNLVKDHELIKRIEYLEDKLK